MRAAIKDRLRFLVGPSSVHDRPASRASAARRAGSRMAAMVEPAVRRPADGPPVSLVAVYRQRNAGTLEQLATATDGAAFWALDDAAPQLASRTLGVGPGTRFALLNRLVTAAPPRSGSWLVIADDDVVVDDLRAAVHVAWKAGLDLSQPSHAPRSHLNWDIGRHRVGRLVRLTPFVDQGPLLILSPRAQAMLLPFPENLGMGWGIEARWARTVLRIGVIDAVTMTHTVPVGAGQDTYDYQAEWSQAEDLLRANGWRDFQHMQHTTAQWWRWQRSCPWAPRT